MEDIISGQLNLLKNDDNEDYLDNDLQYITRTLREYLRMEVAFISEFSEGNRIFKYVDCKQNCHHIDVGNYDPLEESYCQKIVEGEIPPIIQDTSANSITKRMLVTKKLGIKSYLGVPIWLSDGEIYGTICCFGSEVDSSLSERDLATVQLFANIARRQIESKLKTSRLHFEMKQRIEEVLEPSKIGIVYQPIYNMREKRIVGFESLARFSTNPYRTPDLWFAEAAQIGLGDQLEIMAIKNAIAGVACFPDDVYITLNISAEHIVSGAVAAALKGAPANRIVLEITEHAQVADYADIRLALEPLRAQGIRLAVDDVGAGFASFQHIIELGLDMIKLDRSLIRDINKDRSRQAMASALIAFARETGAGVIAEGVENDQELRELQRLGVEKVQGYYIGRPMPLEQALEYSIQFE